MKVLWYSNAPWGKSGYAGQTRLAARHLTRLGHQVAVACNFGLQGGPLDDGDGTRYYPSGYDKRSNDIVQAHADDFGADVIVSLYDAWSLDFKNLRTPWVAWAPVDHQPVPRIVTDALKPAAKVVAYSKFGQAEFAKAGVDAAYIPHGVDLSVYCPGDKSEARERLGLPRDAFVAVMVGTNVGYPSRKCIPQVLAAWSSFLKGQTNRYGPALLYLHTEEQGILSGVKLKPLIDALELGPDVLRLCDQYQYAIGFPEAYIVDVYRAADVLVSPSMGEGFGLPILEAQACGTPVITTEATSMTELTGGGICIEASDCERWWEPQGGWQVVPHEKAIVRALRAAAVAKRSYVDAYDFQKQRALELARQYDFGTVVAPAWDALLRSMEANHGTN